MKLSTEDIKALTIEVEMNHLNDILKMEHITDEQRNKTHNKSMKLLSEQQAILYQNGYYRNDKKHLLINGNGSMNLKLLSELQTN